MKKRFLKSIYKVLFTSMFIFIVSTIIYLRIAIKNELNVFGLFISKIANEGVKSTLYFHLSNLSFLFFCQFLVGLIAITSLGVLVLFLFRLYTIQRRNALVDPLTEVYNRRAIMFFLKKEIKRSERYNHPLSIAICDIDYFKKYNDSNGHLEGDEALKKFARILRQNLREIDVLGRIGGEEFLIVFPETSLKEAKKICERMRSEVEKARFRGEINLPKRSLTTSIGTASLKKTKISGSKRKFLIKEADDKLYEIKKKGRNAVM